MKNVDFDKIYEETLLLIKERFNSDDSLAFLIAKLSAQTTKIMLEKYHQSLYANLQ